MVKSVNVVFTNGIEVVVLENWVVDVLVEFTPVVVLSVRVPLIVV